METTFITIHALTHEPRAALFLNRFSRTLTIVYATNGMADVLGLSANELIGKSFYYCIQENCLREAVKCLESAKANDSIAYLRFWFRDPRQDDRMDQDERMSDSHSSGDEDETGGVHLSELMDHDGSEHAVVSESSDSMRSSVERGHIRPANNDSFDHNSRTSSGDSAGTGGSENDGVFDRPLGGQSRTSSISTPDDSGVSNTSWSRGSFQIELEAVVSCTSDGLVVILRRAKPYVSHMSQSSQATSNVSGVKNNPYANGFFASPWASDPILPNVNPPQSILPNLHGPSHAPVQPSASQANTAAIKGPAAEDFMNSIREVAVFAWSLTGINGSLEQYARGTPTGESQPPGGLPIWEPNFSPGPEYIRPNVAGFLTNDQTYGRSPSHQHQHHHTGDQSQIYGKNEKKSYYDLSGLPIGYDIHTNSNHFDSMHTNGYSDHIARTSYTQPGPWTQQLEQEKRWDALQQPEQNTNGFVYHDDTRQYG
ncbi:hypothetical protein P7C71_g1115, partial [Lecanoromycetidae sp. Uapishka_2]